MPTMTYENYSHIRGYKVKPHELVPGQKYYIENNKEPPYKAVYTGIFIKKENDNAYFRDIKYAVNEFDLKGTPFSFSLDPKWGITFYNDALEVNKNVEHLVYALTGKRSTKKQSNKSRRRFSCIPSIDEQCTEPKHMGIPKDAATIIAFSLEDPDNISKTARNLSTKHKSKHSKGGKSKRRTQRSRKQSKH